MFGDHGSLQNHQVAPRTGRILPEARKISQNAVAWLESEVLAWLESKANVTTEGVAV